jgi:excisionase family DNA binding protein
MEKLLTVTQAAEALAVKPSTIRAWRMKRKYLDFVLCGRAVRIPAESVEQYIRRNTIPARPEVTR